MSNTDVLDDPKSQHPPEGFSGWPEQPSNETPRAGLHPNARRSLDEAAESPKYTPAALEKSPVAEQARSDHETLHTQVWGEVTAQTGPEVTPKQLVAAFGIIARALDGVSPAQQKRLIRSVAILYGVELA